MVRWSSLDNLTSRAVAVDTSDPEPEPEPTRIFKIHFDVKLLSLFPQYLFHR